MTLRPLDAGLRPLLGVSRLSRRGAVPSEARPSRGTTRRLPGAPRALRRPGRLVPGPGRGLRARCVRLRAGETMDWHSTGRREELLLVLDGRVRVEVNRPHRGRRRRIPLRALTSLFLPAGTWHQVANVSRRSARYVYVTGPARA